jgi:AbrB family looped-hinge helix DNA binding protein
MQQSTITKTGQTTIPVEVREAMNLKPHQTIQWEVQPDGSVLVRPAQSALELFGSLLTDIRFSGISQEKKAAHTAIAEQAAKEGLEK